MDDDGLMKHQFSNPRDERAKKKGKNYLRPRREAMFRNFCPRKVGSRSVVCEFDGIKVEWLVEVERNNNNDIRTELCSLGSGKVIMI